jgi:hypothetical protein
MGAPQIFENLIQAKRLHSLSAPAPRIQDFWASLPKARIRRYQTAKEKLHDRNSRRRGSLENYFQFGESNHGR